MNKFLIFIREHNDLDQVLPIIDYLISEKNSTVKIYSTSEKYKKSLLNVKYLENKLHLKVKNIETIYNIFEHLLYRISNHLRNRKNYKIKIFHLFDMVFKNHIIFIINILLSKKINKFTNIHNDYIFLADFGTEDIFPYSYLIKICEIKKIKLVAYNHGMTIFLNKDPIKKLKSKFSKKLTNFINTILHARYNRQLFYQKYTVGIEQKIHFQSNMYKNFRNTELITEIGLPRFTYEWNYKFETFHNKLITKVSTNTRKISVCIFLSNAKFSVDKKKLLHLLKKIQNLKNIELIISPHPRSGITGLAENNFQNNISNDTARILTKKIDLGIIYGTSIAHHLLINKIPFIIPQYIDNNEHLYTKYNVCYTAKNENDLLDHLINFSKEKYFSKEMHNNIDKFINYFIYGNRSYLDLMNKYYKELTS